MAWSIQHPVENENEDLSVSEALHLLDDLDAEVGRLEIGLSRRADYLPVLGVEEGSEELANAQETARTIKRAGSCLSEVRRYLEELRHQEREERKERALKGQTRLPTAR